MGLGRLGCSSAGVGRLCVFVPSYPGQLSLRGPELNEAHCMRKDSLKSKRVEKVTARDEV